MLSPPHFVNKYENVVCFKNSAIPRPDIGIIALLADPGLHGENSMTSKKKKVLPNRKNVDN